MFHQLQVFRIEMERCFLCRLLLEESERLQIRIVIHIKNPNLQVTLHCNDDSIRSNSDGTLYFAQQMYHGHPDLKTSCYLKTMSLLCELVWVNLQNSLSFSNKYHDCFEKTFVSCILYHLGHKHLRNCSANPNFLQ